MYVLRGLCLQNRILHALDVRPSSWHPGVTVQFVPAYLSVYECADVAVHNCYYLTCQTIAVSHAIYDAVS